MAETAASTVLRGFDRQPRQPIPFTLWSLEECAAARPRPYIVKGLIARRDLVILFGPPGAGKSVLAPYLAHGVATGRPMFGRRVKPVAVLYVAAEDGAGMKQRAAALLRCFGTAPALCIIADAISLTPTEEGEAPHVAGLREAARRIGAGVIVLDTVAAAFPGLDENDGRSMGECVRTLRRLAEPDPAPGAWRGAAVIAVHHGAKGAPGAPGGTPRGHGVLNGDADVTLRIDVPEDGAAPRNVKLGKNRNGSTMASLAFTIRAETLGTDDDGDAITAPIAEEQAEASAQAKPPPRLPPPAQLMLREIQSLLAEGQGRRLEPAPGMGAVECIPRAALRARLIKTGWFSEDQLLPNTLPERQVLATSGYRCENKYLNTLKAKALAGFSREEVWLV